MITDIKKEYIQDLKNANIHLMHNMSNEIVKREQIQYDYDSLKEKHPHYFSKKTIADIGGCSIRIKNLQLKIDTNNDKMLKSVLKKTGISIS